MRPVTMLDDEEVVMNMPKNKAPKLDGFTTYFFQSCWGFLGKEIQEVVEELRHLGIMYPIINVILLTLVPKTR